MPIRDLPSRRLPLSAVRFVIARIKEAKNRIAKVQNSQNCSQPTGTMR